MRVFIAIDMEGATGVVHRDQLMPEGRGYPAAQRLLTRDVNAVIAGIRSVEPDADIVVGDGHGVMRNVLLDELDPSARLVIGPANVANKPLCQLEGVQFGADVAFCIGYHSMAGTAGGLLAHTYVGSLIRELRLNGHPAGEVEVNASVLASFGVPLAMVSGNSDVEAELRAWNDRSVFVSTKQSLGPTAAICKTPTTTARELEAGARRAMEDRTTWYLPHAGRTRIEIDTFQREQFHRAMQSGVVVGVGEMTFAADHDHAAEAFRHAWRACTMALDEASAWLK
ncbi:MAG: hypothetical protein RIR53_821 [Bacteroidota bacterium]|jgi:D-amino peptidase